MKYLHADWPHNYLSNDIFGFAVYPELTEHITDLIVYTFLRHPEYHVYVTDMPDVFMLTCIMHIEENIKLQLPNTYHVCGLIQYYQSH